MTDPIAAAAASSDIVPAVDATVSSAIRKASASSGIPFELMMATAKLESGFQPGAQASTSSASGLFQFTQQTWLNAVKEHGVEHGLAPEAAAIVDHGGRLTTSDPAMRKRILDLRNDPSSAAALAGDYMRDMSNTLSASLGRPATPGEIYLAHFLGVGGARQMISAAPNQAAASVIPAAAHANATMFYARNGSPYTVAQFMDNLQNRVRQAVADVSPLTGGSSMLADATNIGAGVRQAASKVTGNAPDAPESSAAGWGVATPTVLKSLGESQVMASLVSAFTQSDQRSSVTRTHRNGLGPEMPPAVLTALQMTS